MWIERFALYILFVGLLFEDKQSSKLGRANKWQMNVQLHM